MYVSFTKPTNKCLSKIILVNVHLNNEIIQFASTSYLNGDGCYFAVNEYTHNYLPFMQKSGITYEDVVKYLLDKKLVTVCFKSPAYLENDKDNVNYEYFLKLTPLALLQVL